MNLYAVHTDDPDPANWKPWEEVELVIAESPKQAVEMCGYNWPNDEDHIPVVEVDMSEAKRLIGMPPYVED